MRSQVRSRSDLDLEEAMQVHLSHKPAMGKKSDRKETVPDDDDSDNDEHEKPKPKPKKPDGTLALVDKPKPAKKSAKIKKISVWETPYATKEDKKKNWSSWPSI